MQLMMLVFHSIKEGIDESKYTEIIEKSVKNLREYKEDGSIVEFKAYKNLLGAPTEVMVITWRSVEDWAKFFESSKYQRLLRLESAFHMDVRVEMLYSL